MNLIQKAIKKTKKHYVYTLIIDYSTDDYEGVEIYLYATRDKAIKEMENFIKSEKHSFWIAEAFDNNGDLIDDNFELDSNFEEDKDITDNLWWNIRDKNDSYLHTHIDLMLKEIE